MESEKRQFDWKQFSEAIVLINAGGNGDEFSLLRRLISEASDRYPQLSQLHFTHIPLPIHKLESWSYWLAAQVVAQWHELPMEDPSVTTVIDKLGLSSAESRALLLDALDETATGTSLNLQVAKRIQMLSEQLRQQKLTPTQQQQCLEQEATKLAAWFTQPLSAPAQVSQSLMAESGCLAQLHFNMLELRSKTQRLLQNYLSRQRAGAQALLPWLDSLVKALHGIRADYEAQQQDYLRQESSAWRAYYKLSMPLEERKWGLSRSRLHWEAALRALAMAYEFKLGAQMYASAAQLVGELVQQTRLWIGSVVKVSVMLDNLEGWLAKRGSVEPLFVPLLKKSLAEQIEPAQLLSDLESWVGCTLDQWSTLDPTQMASLCEQIMARTRPLCLEVYAECCRCVLNLDPLNHQTQSASDRSPEPAMLAPMSPDPEKRVSLYMSNTNIHDALAMLAHAGKICVVADKEIGGTVSLTR